MIKNEYNEFIIASIDYIRLFGKNSYIKLYRKHIIYIINSDYDIEDVDVSMRGYEFLRIHFTNILTNDLTYSTYILQNEYYTIGQDAHNLLKALKRAIKIHKLNSDD